MTKDLPYMNCELTYMYNMCTGWQGADKDGATDAALTLAGLLSYLSHSLPQQ